MRGAAARPARARRARRRRRPTTRSSSTSPRSSASPNVVRDPLAVLRRQRRDAARRASPWRARQPSRRRLLYASTSEVYAGALRARHAVVPHARGQPAHGRPARRARAPAYMLAKIYGEAMCHQARVPFTIVRPHNVYGPRMGMAHVIPELLQRAHAAPDGDELSWRPSTTGARSASSTTRSSCSGASPPRRRPRAARSTSASSAPEVTMRRARRHWSRTAVGKRLEIVPRPTTPGSPPRRCPDMTRTHRLIGDAAARGPCGRAPAHLRLVPAHAFAPERRRRPRSDALSRARPPPCAPAHAVTDRRCCVAPA